MCGICGFLSKKKESLDNLIRMNDTLVHMDPDDRGEEIYSIGLDYVLGWLKGD